MTDDPMFPILNMEPVDDGVSWAWIVLSAGVALLAIVGLVLL